MGLLSSALLYNGPKLTLSSGTIGVGRGFSAIVSGGVLKTSGTNHLGQLARDVSSEVNHGYGDSTLEDVVALVSGLHHMVAFTGEGKAHSVGYNRYGQLGNLENVGTRLPNKAFMFIGDYVGGDCGDFHTCLLDDLGNLYTCGQNRQGQLGRAPYQDQVESIALANTDVKEVRCGRHFTVVLKNDGTLWGCGYNRHGQLGVATNVATNDPTDWVLIDSGVEVFACGSNHLVYTKSNVLYSCGHNYYGQLGHSIGLNTNEPNSTKINTGITDVQDLDCGSSHTIYKNSLDEIWGLGYNLYQQISDTPSKVNELPTLVATNVAAFRCGAKQTVYVTGEGKAFGRGWNGTFALGSAETSNSLRELPITY